MAAVIELNEKAVSFAQEMIKKYEFDNKEWDWTRNKPTPEDEDNYLQHHDLDDYGKWFLGINTQAPENSKERYEYPIGNFKYIFKSGLIAAEQRGAQYHHESIREAASMLLDMMAQ